MIAIAEDQFRGSFTPLVTPFSAGQIDYDAFAAMVERQVREGSHGIVVTGTTGEPTSLSTKERRELYRVAVASAAGRLPVVAATGSSNHQDTLALTEASQREGVSAVLVVAPAFVKPSQDGLARHFIEVAQRVDLPFLIYNIPGRSGVPVSVGAVLRVAEACENLVGLKHASPDLDPITSLLDELGAEFRIFCGLESYSYPMLALGAAGLMNAVGNIAPGMVAALCDAVAGGDHHRALELHRALFAVNEAIFFETNPVPLKHMLARLGVGTEEVRLPLTGLDDATTKRVDRALDSLTADVGVTLR